MQESNQEEYKRVSIVIPTWQRRDLLLDTIRHISKQAYPNFEVVVVSDGLDSFNAELQNLTLEKPMILQVIYLGRNWSGIDPSSFGVAPLMTGYLVARGDYIMPWCDDERAYTPWHILDLVSILEEDKVDFVYPKVKIWRNGNPNGPETAIIGTVPPEHGQITHYLFRAECLWKYGMPEWHSHPMDWNLVRKWMQNGATYSMLNEVTFEHRLDR